MWNRSGFSRVQKRVLILSADSRQFLVQRAVQPYLYQCVWRGDYTNGLFCFCFCSCCSKTYSYLSVMSGIKSFPMR